MKHIKRSIVLGMLFASSVFGSPVWAAPASDDADESALASKEGEVTKYDFEDDNVDGELLSPDGANISSRGQVKHASLINIRPHFIAEMVKMANDI